MDIQLADYLFGCLLFAFALLGVCRGFSGTLAFLVGVIAAAAVVVFGWPMSTRIYSDPWSRGMVVFIATVLAYALARWIVKKTVKHLLTQPSDSIFGLVLGVLAAFLLLAFWSASGFYTSHSVFATRLAPYVQF